MQYGIQYCQPDYLKKTNVRHEVMCKDKNEKQSYYFLSQASSSGDCYDY